MSDCQGFGEEGVNKWSTEDFQCSETILYETIMVDTCCYTAVKTHRVYNTKAEHKCKLWTLDDNDMSVQVY